MEKAIYSSQYVLALDDVLLSFWFLGSSWDEQRFDDRKICEIDDEYGKYYNLRRGNETFYGAKFVAKICEVYGWSIEYETFI